jgi:hypothetical protein
MAEVERTSAGLQTIIPGCERRTLLRSRRAWMKTAKVCSHVGMQNRENNRHETGCGARPIAYSDQALV